MIHTRNILYIWKGNQVPRANIDRFTEVAQSWCRILQAHERAPVRIVSVNQGDESAEFWEMFGPGSKAPAIVREWPSIDVSLLLHLISVARGSGEKAKENPVVKADR